MTPKIGHFTHLNFYRYKAHGSKSQDKKKTNESTTLK